MAGRSSLNPRAASFVPLSKTKSDAEKGSKNHDEALPQPQHLLESNTKTMPQSLQVKNNPSPPKDVTEWIEEDADVDVEFLKMIFPDFAEQSLRDVYFLNYADLNAAIDMLNHLEFNCDESSETLDNGNVSESASAADSASPKLNNTAAKASASSNPMTPANK